MSVEPKVGKELDEAVLLVMGYTLRGETWHDPDGRPSYLRSFPPSFSTRDDLATRITIPWLNTHHGYDVDVYFARDGSREVALVDLDAGFGDCMEGATFAEKICRAALFVAKRKGEVRDD